MKMKLLVAIVDDSITEEVIEAARRAGATGATIINSVRGEGLKVEKTFLGLDLTGQRDIVLFLVVAERARAILETIDAAGGLSTSRTKGIALQLDLEDAVGLQTQIAVLREEIEDEV